MPFISCYAEKGRLPSAGGDSLFSINQTICIYKDKMNAVLSGKGRVTIPKLIRDEMGLSPGIRLDFKESKGCIIVRKVADIEDPIRAWRGKGQIPRCRSVDGYLLASREKK